MMRRTLATLIAAAGAVMSFAPAVAATAELKPEDASFVAYPRGDLVIRNVKLIDGTGGPSRTDITVLVKDGRIAWVGASSRAKPAPGATAIDAKGKTMLPGFVMVHEHLFYPSSRPGYLTSSLYAFPRLYLAGGTTTLRTAGSISPEADINVARAIKAGEQPGPDMDVTGPYLEGPVLLSPQLTGLANAADAERSVAYWAQRGATSFKAYNYLSRATLKGAIDAAHARGFKITGHLCSVTYHEAIALGIDNLEHSFAEATDFVPGKQPDQCPGPKATMLSLLALDPDGPEIGELIQSLVRSRVALTSTLAVFETFAAGRPKTPDHALDLLTPELRDAYERGWQAAQQSEFGKANSAFLPRLMRMERRFVDMGGTLLAGTDPTGIGGIIPGWAASRQVELMVEAGFPLPQAVQIATLNGARYLNRQGDVGTIEAGKRADFILLDGDPEQDVRKMEAISYVFKNGIGYRSQAILAAMKGKVGLY